MGELMRLTALGSGRDGHGAIAGRPSLAIAEGDLLVAFSLERDKKRRVMLLEVALSDPTLSAGVKATGKKKMEDRSVGKLISVSTTEGQHGDARLVCEKDECFVAWDDDKAGAFAAFLDRRKGQTIWHREFTRNGSGPAIVKSPTGASPM